MNVQDMSRVTPLRHAAYRGEASLPPPSSPPWCTLSSPSFLSLFCTSVDYAPLPFPLFHVLAPLTLFFPPGEESVVRLLLHYGADPTLADAQGGLPVQVRSLSGFIPLMLFLFLPSRQLLV